MKSITFIKRQILISLALILSTTFIYAQKLVPNSVIKAQSDSFVTELLPHMDGDKTGDRIIVNNSKNVYHNKVQKNRKIGITVERSDKGGMLKAFTQVFSDERLRQLLSEKVLMMTFYLNPSGKILEISFLLNKNTLLTAREIESLEKAIKANVGFKVRPEDIEGRGFIDISWIISYSRVLDRTLK